MVMAPIFRSVTRKKGLAMVLTGEQISARQAEGMGLVTLVVPKVQLDETVREMAERMAGLSPTALALAKEAFYTMTDMEYTKSLRYLRELITITSLTEDVKEGIAAFYEKRPPRWQGR
jgi:enoyl-CoA hydratase/carnithine racemase